MTKLEELGILIQRVQDFEAVKEQLESSLTSTQERIAYLTDTAIPAIMDAIGAEKITTTEGWEIKVGDVYHASISDKNRHQAFTWLRDHGHGALIKNKVSVIFNAGEDIKAEQIATDLTDHGLDVTVKEEVNPQTLKGFVREQKEAGNDFPDAVFGVYHMRKVTMKRKNDSG